MTIPTIMTILTFMTSTTIATTAIIPILTARGAPEVPSARRPAPEGSGDGRHLLGEWYNIHTTLIRIMTKTNDIIYILHYTNTNHTNTNTPRAAVTAATI